MRRPFMFVVLGILVVFAIVGTLLLSSYREHVKSSGQLLRATDTLVQENPGLRLMDSALITLHEAENNFRMFTTVYEKRYLAAFGVQLQRVTELLDSVSTPIGGQEKSTELTELMKKKQEMSGRLAALKKATDSLLTRSLKDEMIDRLLSSIPAFSVKKIKKDDVVMDTISSAPPAKEEKKGFFKRFGAAMAGKKDTIKSSFTVRVRTRDGKVIDKEAYDAQRMKAILNDVNVYYKDILRKQLSGRMQINTAEQSLAGSNIALLEELKTLIQHLKAQTLRAEDAKKKRALGIVNESVANIGNRAFFGTLAIVMCIALIALLIYLVVDYYRKLDVARKAAQEEARMRTDFLTNMSHEIRTPLNSIVGFSEQLSHTPLEKDQRELLRAVEVSGDMLMEVVNDVLDFAKLENDYISIQQQPFVFYEAFREVISAMRVQAEQKKLQFNATFEGNKQWQVSGDVFRLKQILFNLISNAIKYTDKGSITIMAKLEKETEQKAHFVFSVEDTGQGISPEAQPRIFERFYQARSPRITEVKGTGLGLAITRKLVLLHGGDISFTSEVDKGTRFHCNIPYEVVSAPLTVVVTRNESDKPGTLMEGKYVLVADDQEMNLLLMKMILTRWKCRFDMAVDGAMAVALFEQNHYDLVMLDLHMPKLSGIDVVEQIRRDKNPDKAKIPVLALTANISQQDIEDFRKAGFDAWVLKPFREKDIYKVIVDHLPPPQEHRQEA